MESTIQSNTPPIQPQSEISVSQSYEGLKKILIIVLGLILIPSLFFVGFLIGRKQTPNQQQINEQSVSCSEVLASNQIIENTVYGIIKKSKDIPNNYITDIKDMYTKSKGLDIFINKNNIFILMMGGEMEKIIKSSLSGNDITSCENSWLIGDVTASSNPSCKIPSDAVLLSTYLEQRYTNCLNPTEIPSSSDFSVSQSSPSGDIKKVQKCTHDKDCPINTFCDYSVPGGMTPDGYQSGTPSGTQTCIQKCQINDDCPNKLCEYFYIHFSGLANTQKGCKP